MWEVPRYRIRAYLRGLKRTRDSSVSRERAPFRIKRVQAEIGVSAGFAQPVLVVRARVILNDMTPDGLYLFCSRPLYPGQSVSLTIQEPRRFFVLARVSSCKRLSHDPRVLSTEGSYPYRVGIEFDIYSRDERAAVEEYCGIIAEILYGSHTA